MRSILLISASERQDGAAALSCGASALLMALERAGEPRAAALERARETIAAAEVLPARPRLFVRLGPVADDKIDADLAALVAPGLDGVCLEGCEGRVDVQRLSTKLAVHEAKAGLPAGSVRIVALAAQTPASVFALGGYRGASHRLSGLALDATPLPGGAAAAQMARTLLVLGAAAAGLGAFVHAPDLAGSALESAIAAARAEGFTGLIARSPAQIGPIERAFSAP